jgi:hypothetical protein
MDKKELTRQRAKEWYYANRTKALNRIKSYRLLPGWIEKRKEYRKKWYAKNKQKLLLQRHEPEYRKHYLAVRKIYRSKPEIRLKHRIQKREWDLKNKKLINAKTRFFIHNKYVSDPHFKLIKTMHNQLLKGLKYHNFTKKNRTFVLLGYSAKDLKEHLEKQFTPEMDWSNYGTYWHIDHKIPQSFAHNEKELIELYQLDNLQPLEAKANVSKHNRQIADLFGSGSWFK